jgi:DNA (cytosine-5)-methyltransferase 1
LQLSARFAEWLMGLRDGWVTDVPNIVAPKKDPRTEQLHKIGNGGAPLQAHEAWRRLMTHKAFTEEN